MSSSVSELMILLTFSISGHPLSTPMIFPFIGSPPSSNIVKCNRDGAARGCLVPAACGGIFRVMKGELISCFSANMGTKNAYQAELFGAMIAIELANQKGWHTIWLES